MKPAYEHQFPFNLEGKPFSELSSKQVARIVYRNHRVMDYNTRSLPQKFDRNFLGKRVTFTFPHKPSEQSRLLKICKPLMGYKQPLIIKGMQSCIWPNIERWKRWRDKKFNYRRSVYFRSLSAKL